jgi:hypothetical protein
MLEGTVLDAGCAGAQPGVASPDAPGVELVAADVSAPWGAGMDASRTRYSYMSTADRVVWIKDRTLVVFRKGISPTRDKTGSTEQSMHTTD